MINLKVVNVQSTNGVVDRHFSCNAFTKGLLTL